MLLLLWQLRSLEVGTANCEPPVTVVATLAKALAYVDVDGDGDVVVTRNTTVAAFGIAIIISILSVWRQQL